MQTNQMQLMQLINQLSFAAFDTGLYLDTHPTDVNALEYFNYLNNMRQQAVAEYTAMFGPLTMEDVTSNNEWTWINNPWPWEGAGCSCGTMKKNYSIQ
jgi:spore coat protein JB